MECSKECSTEHYFVPHSLLHKQANQAGGGGTRSAGNETPGKKDRQGCWVYNRQCNKINFNPPSHGQPNHRTHSDGSMECYYRLVDIGEITMTVDIKSAKLQMCGTKTGLEQQRKTSTRSCSMSEEFVSKPCHVQERSYLMSEEL